MMSPGQKKISKVLNIVSVVLLLIALFLGSSSVTVGISMFSNVDAVNLEAQSFCEEPTAVTGVITTASFEENTIVTYEFDGNEYTSEQIVYSDECPVGKEVTVYVNPSAPSNVRIPEVFIPVYQKYGKVILIGGLSIIIGNVIISIILMMINKSMKNKSRKSD